MIKGDRWKYSLVVALLFIFSLMLGCPAKGQISQPQVVFDEAGKAIQENNYPEAKQKLKSLLEANYEHGAVQLNLGYIYAVQDSLGNAIYYFRQAELHPEYQQQAKEGLRYARQRLPNREVVLPKLPWQQAFDWAGRTIGSNGLMTATLLFLYITVFFTLLYWFTQFMHHKGTLYLIYGSLLITLLLAIGSIHIAHLQQKYDIGVLVSSEQPVYSESDRSSSIISSAYEGYSFTIDYSQSKPDENWYYVRLSNGMFGWIEGDGLRIYEV
jgi:hypothetical protein